MFVGNQLFGQLDVRFPALGGFLAARINDADLVAGIPRTKGVAELRLAANRRAVDFYDRVAGPEPRFVSRRPRPRRARARTT